jgi:hypothetical protein
MHPELEGSALLVSGHHGFTAQSGDRLIIDTSGGKHGDHNPIEAIILPTRKLVSSTPDEALSTRFEGWKSAPSRTPVPEIARKLTQLEKEAEKAKVDAKSNCCI